MKNKKCDIKESAEAYNTGVDALEKAFLLTGDPTKSFKYAVSEIQQKHPDLDFDPNSFINPIAESMKEKGLIPESYKFSESKRSDEQKTVEKTVEKFKGLDQDQKKTLSKKLYSKLAEQNILTNDEIQNIYAEAVGIPAMTDEIKSLVKESSSAMKEYDKVDTEIKSIYGEIEKMKSDQEGKVTPEQDSALISRIKELAIRQQKAKAQVNRAQTKLAQELREKSFWMWDLADNIRMNLMTPVSLLKNLTGAGVDLAVRQPKNAVSSILSTMINPITEKKYGSRSGRIGSRFLGGLMNADKSFKNSMESWGYGRTEFDKKLPAADYLNAVTAYKKMVDSTGKQKIINSVAFALKVTPDFIKRTLGATDAFFYDNAVRSELERISSQKSLKGAEKELFLLNPDEESLLEAQKLAEEVTFRKNISFFGKKIKTSYDAREHYKQLVKNGESPMTAKIKTGFASIVTTLFAPFVKTPLNIIRLASRYVLPEYELGRSISLAIKAKTGDEKQQLIADGIAHAAVGYYLRSVALQAIAAGAISSGFGDEDKETMDAIEKQFGGANRMNWSAILRIMTGGDGAWQEGDKTVDLNAMGVLGVVMGTYARAFNEYSEEERKDNAKFSKIFTKSPSVILPVAGTAMDLSFLSGTNQVIEALKSKSNEEKTGKLGINWIKAALGGIMPSTFQKLSTSTAENKKQSYDKNKDWNENLANAVGYNFLFSGGKDMKNKYYSLANDKEAIQKKDYMLFDNYLGRALQEEFGVFKSKDVLDGPLKKLLDTSMSVERDSREKMFPNAVDKKQSFGKGKNKVSIELTNEQHEFLMEKTSEFRMVAATPYINSEEFDNDSYDVKAETLSRLYKDGLDAAKNLTAIKYGDQLKGENTSKKNKQGTKSNYKKYGKKKKRTK